MALGNFQIIELKTIFPDDTEVSLLSEDIEKLKKLTRKQPVIIKFYDFEDTVRCGFSVASSATNTFYLIVGEEMYVIQAFTNGKIVRANNVNTLDLSELVEDDEFVEGVNEIIDEAIGEKGIVTQDTFTDELSNLELPISGDSLHDYIDDFLSLSDNVNPCAGGIVNGIMANTDAWGDLMDEIADELVNRGFVKN